MSIALSVGLSLWSEQEAATSQVCSLGSSLCNRIVLNALQRGALGHIVFHSLGLLFLDMVSGPYSLFRVVILRPSCRTCYW